MRVLSLAQPSNTHPFDLIECGFIDDSPQMTCILKLAFSSFFLLTIGGIDLPSIADTLRLDACVSKLD